VVVLATAACGAVVTGLLGGCYGRGALGGTPYYGPGSKPVPAPASLSGSLNRPKRLYVANSGSNDIWIANFDPAGSGAVYPINTNTVPTGQVPLAIQGHPTVNFIAVANAGSGDIWTYKVDPKTGNLIRFGTPISIGNVPTAMKWSTNGKFLYVLSNGAQGPTLTTYNFDPTTLLITSSNNSTTIGNPTASSTTNPSTGQQTVTPTVQGTATALSIQGSGDFGYVSIASPDQMAVIHLNSDGSTAVNGNLVSGGPGQSAIAAYPGGRFVYVTNAQSGDISFFSVDPNHNLILNPTPVPVGQIPYDIKIDVTGVNCWVVDLQSADVVPFSILGTSGLLTRLTTSAALNIQDPPVNAPPGDPWYGPYSTSNPGQFPTGTKPVGGGNPVGPNSCSIAITDDRKFAYTLNLGFQTPTAKEPEGICMFTVNNDGTLTPMILPNASLTLPDPISPNGQNPYATSQNNGTTSLPQPDDITIY
jgi:6-phosphogluconolactonase (cycloisomerase 2 family)